jgi:hypothetical protein
MHVCDVESKNPTVAGLSNSGGRNAVSVRSPTSSDWPGLIRCTRSMGSGRSVDMMPALEKVVTTFACGGGLEELEETTGVVAVGVGQPDPPDVLGVEHRAETVHEVTVRKADPGVHDDRLRSVEHEGVDGQEPDRRDLSTVLTTVRGVKGPVLLATASVHESEEGLPPVRREALSCVGPTEVSPDLGR